MNSLCRLHRSNGDRMSEAYHKDILRSIRKGWKRFLSIFTITALGVGMLTGLYAASLDMYYSADQYFDQQNLFDIRVLSTMGLTREDVDALAEVKGVEAAEGGYSKTVFTDENGVRKSAEIIVLSRSGLNTPYLLAGRMPAKEGEIAVTQKYLDESGKTIGDVLLIEEDIKDNDDENSKEKQPEAGEADENDALDADIDLEMEWEEDEEGPVFTNTSYLITGAVLDSMNIKSEGNGSDFRSTSTTDYTFFITEADAAYDIFTVVYITLSDTKKLNSYSDEYEDAVRSVIHDMESQIKMKREQARDHSILLEARSKIQDAENTMNEKLEEADRKFSDAWEEITEARQELADGEADLLLEQEDAERKIAKARAEIKSAKKRLAEAEDQLAEGKAQLTDNETELNEKAQGLEQGKKQLAQERQQAEEQFAAAEQQLAEAQNQLDANRAQLEAGAAQLQQSLGDAWPENEWNALVNAAAALAATGADDTSLAEGTALESAALAGALQAPMEALAESIIQAGLGMGRVIGSQRALDAQRNHFLEQKKAALQQMADAEAELAEGENQISEARRMLQAKKIELEEGMAELADRRADLADGEAKLNAEEADSRSKIADAWEELSEGKEELAENEAKLMKQEREYTDQKKEARQKLADAYAELDDIDKTKWYIQDRSSLESYSSLNSDLTSIEAIGRFFPIIFLLVAILMSLTTMTRMVEEERGLIGSYKAMGFDNAAIYRKYLLFAFFACLLGGFLGNLFGFIVMPRFIMTILKALYSLPQYTLRFDFLYGIGGVMLFMAAIVGATALACRSELKQMPARLLRPKAPRPGSRVLLERIPFIWNRLSFLNKVTIRNLFRYKKRLFMTIGGIMGCTALILCGFAIKDSVAELAPQQYDSIYHYDLMAVFNDEDNDDLTDQLAGDKNIDKYLNLRIEGMKLINAAGRAEQVQLLVIPGKGDIKEYIRLVGFNKRPADLGDQGVIITQNAARLLELEAGDTVSLQNLEFVQQEAAVSGIVQNYLGNNVYMTQELYESLFGAYIPNGVIAHLSDACTDHAAYAKGLLDNDSVLSAISTAALKEDFGFDLMYAVVLLLIVMAGGLAFVVLFTLSNTNISERVRELATIKVLGFYDNEVYQYVNKETLILTAAGILLGLPAGYVLSGLLMTTLIMPSIHFALHIEPASYLISAAITLCFALIVNWITNRTLDRINMVEALKSVE